MTEIDQVSKPKPTDRIVSTIMRAACGAWFCVSFIFWSIWWLVSAMCFEEEEQPPSVTAFGVWFCIALIFGLLLNKLIF
jgi:ABC-type thiamin/hydroxymethylpyrimidine transport system permease subunit